MKPFAENVDSAKLPGHHGSFYGQYDVLMHDTPNPPEGNTVSMMLGWDSKEAHLAERGEGKCEYNSRGLWVTTTTRNHIQFLILPHHTPVCVRKIC